MSYENKYIKYKNKYLKLYNHLNKQSGGFINTILNTESAIKQKEYLELILSSLSSLSTEIKKQTL